MITHIRVVSPDLVIIYALNPGMYLKAVGAGELMGSVP